MKLDFIRVLTMKKCLRGWKGGCLSSVGHNRIANEQRFSVCIFSSELKWKAIASQCISATHSSTQRLTGYCNPDVQRLYGRCRLQCWTAQQQQQQQQVICFNVTIDGGNKRGSPSPTPQTPWISWGRLYITSVIIPYSNLKQSRGLLGARRSDLPCVPHRAIRRVCVGGCRWWCSNSCGATLYLSCHACKEQHISVRSGLFFASLKRE